ncbi:DUF5053 domain-containing protein [Bacteroides sp. GD17]|uniref:DUF5053 domain-containing protein n=1 Tax=Bacteroides sp. GD17 TaxID=3139826 RepID=UPI0025ED6E18|nr:DUF5053 domain-containing protein [uncultured Bacteroides sp.]
MRTIQEILSEMKPLMGSMNAEERKRLNALEEELKIFQMTAEDKAVAQTWYEEGVNEIKESLGRIEYELKIKDQLKEVTDILPLSYIAKNYFGKSAAWLYQRINGNKVRGKVYTLNHEEIATFNRALKEIGNKISSLSITS